MARKSKSRVYAASVGGRRAEAPGARRRRRRKWIIGGVVLVLVLGLGGLMRWRQQQGVVTQLQTVSSGSSRYTRGPAGAPVVIKEFSDYT